MTQTWRLLWQTGVLGSLSGDWPLDQFRMQNPMARGLALGTVSHAQGTAAALQEGEQQGAMAGLAMIPAGIFTAAFAPVGVWLLNFVPVLTPWAGPARAVNNARRLYSQRLQASWSTAWARSLGSARGPLPSATRGWMMVWIPSSASSLSGTPPG